MSWGTPSGVNMDYSWPSLPAPKPNNSPEIPIPWGSDRPSAPSENNMSPKKVDKDSWGQNRSENSYISRNDVVQVDRFPERSKESTKLPDNVPPVNMGSPLDVEKISEQRDDDQQMADIALQAVLQNSFESEKERKEQKEQQNSEDDFWDPTYRRRSDISQSAKGRAEPSITSPNSTLPKKEFRDVEVQTEIIDLNQIIASKEKLLSCMIDSPIMKDYQQNVRHSSQQSMAPSLMDMGPEELEDTFNRRTNVGVESSWNKSSSKSDFHDNIISPTISETNAREPDNDSRRPIQPPINENPSRNNNLDFDPQPTSVQRGPSPSADWGTASQQTPTQDNFFSQQPVRDNQSNKNDRSQDVSYGNLGEQQSNKPDSWEGGQSGGLDWTKKAEMFEKELGAKDQKTEESYGTFNDNSSSNNRYGNRDSSRDGNRYGNRGSSRDGYGNRDVSRDGNRYGNRDVSRDSNRDSNRHGNRDSSRDGNRYDNRDVSRDGNRYGNRDVSRDSNRDGNRYGNRTDESSRDVKTCHKCKKEGHMARDCPDELCYKCNKPGHRASNCNEDAYETTGQDGNFGEGSRDYNHPKFSPFSDPLPSDISSEDAWAKLLKADKEKDIDDFKEAFELYAKSTPKETFQTIERKLRDSNCNARIVALEREEIPLASILVDLQGNTNKKYVATPVMGSPNNIRRTAGAFAPTEEENYKWLADAGFMVDDNKSLICYNCKQKGHLTKDCKEPRKEPEKPSPIGCQNCGSPEHMTKYCSEERRDYYTEARDRKTAGSHNRDRDRDPINDDKASSVYDGEEGKGFRGYASSSSQTCHNCHKEGHKSRDCPEKQSGGGDKKCFNCGKEGHFSKDCQNSDRGNNNDYNQTTSLNTDYNSRSKTGDDNTSQWNKSGGSTISRDDQNYDNISQNREVRNDVVRDSSVSTQDRRTIQQKDITPYNTEKSNVVEPDTWDSNKDAAQKIDWESKTHTFSDFWGTDNNKKESVSDKQNKAPEDYENKRGDPYNKSSDDYDNRRGRGNDYSYNKGTDDYGGRGRGNDSYNNNRSDDYGGRGRNSSYNNNRSDDYGRGRNNNNSYNNSDDYDNNKRGRDNYNNKGSDDYGGRGRGNDSYNNNRSDDYGGRGRNSSYNNNRSDDYGRGRGNDSYNNRSDDYGRGRGNDSYSNRSDDYGRSRGNDSYSNRSDDFGRNRGGNSYNNNNNDYGRSRGNDSYNKGSGDYGRNRGNDYSHNRGSDDYDSRRDRRTQEQNTQSNEPPPNLDNVQTWW